MAINNFSESSCVLPPSVRKNPPFSFVSKMKKMEKVDGTDLDKSEWIKLEFLMIPDNSALGLGVSPSTLIYSRMNV
jgi:hypothetical protein